jgi:hypothetical protein
VKGETRGEDEGKVPDSFPELRHRTRRIVRKFYPKTTPGFKGIQRKGEQHDPHYKAEEVWQWFSEANGVVQNRMEIAREAIITLRHQKNQWLEAQEKYPLSYGFMGLLDYIEHGNPDKIAPPEIADLVMKLIAFGVVQNTTKSEALDDSNSLSHQKP